MAIQEKEKGKETKWTQREKRNVYHAYIKQHVDAILIYLDVLDFPYS